VQTASASSCSTSASPPASTSCPRTREIQLVIKSRAALFEPLRQCILAHHPYEVPEILALPASQGHPAYLDWLTQETS